jgi:hypothetical protein
MTGLCQLKAWNLLFKPSSEIREVFGRGLRLIRMPDLPAKSVLRIIATTLFFHVTLLATPARPRLDEP